MKKWGNTNGSFLGVAFWRRRGKNIKKSKDTVHYAVNKFQWGLIDGFVQIDNLELGLLTAPFKGGYFERNDYDSFQNKKK